MDKILNAVIENNKKLEGCSGHLFDIDLSKGSLLNKRWKCSLCKGEISGINKQWYELGIKHAKGEMDHE